MKKYFGQYIPGILICIFICQLAGVVGAFYTMPVIKTWYAGLSKPFFNPPNWIFGPVWTILFTMQGVALFLVWQRRRLDSPGVKLALEIFFLQLILNSLWSIFFFGWRIPVLAFGEIIFLWLAIASTIKYFYRVSKPAAWLLIPYILWVSFAALLNFFIILLNP